MHARTQYTPLTEMEQSFAEANLKEVDRFLSHQGLDPEEWYDVVIFRYLLSVKRYVNQARLHRWKFSTIAWNAMRSAVWSERQKQKKRIQTVSLDEVIPGTEDTTLLDTITHENLNMIYIGGNDVNIKYNVKLPERKGPTKSDEVIAIESFIGTKMKNMCFEYETTDEAKKKSSTIAAYKRKMGHKEIYDNFRLENCIYIVRKEQKGGKA